ncbi:hypothetical protein [Wansuia hejianensis]|uniref:Uncharacterized protein n=1 Tax=Wansuia hejianensis TaxID=2763667 RepID=A0A926EXN4_9FIRM|nr:hypothetical protein [Wansuia hejianensis]MBC8590405.1 hypothetical protein [Wansuia hejianensis]
MALSSSKAHDIYEGLKYNFLFNNDINCIHILLNLYDLENNINNIFPKYISINTLRRNISKLLKDRKGNHLIAYNLGELIHEDINRLELFLYLEGYRHGYFDNKTINALEDITIKYYSIYDLYNMKYLFHFDTKISEINDFKSSIYDNMYRKEDYTDKLNNTVIDYMNNIIKPKVISLNKHLDKQLTINYDSSFPNIKAEDDTLLTLNELNDIYKEVEKVMLRNGFKLYQDSYWKGLNDRVLKRYR